MRFGAVVRLSAALTPLARARAARAPRARRGWTTLREELVWAGLALLDERRIEYDLGLELRGAEHLPARGSAARGTLIVTVHGALNRLLTRVMHDRGGAWHAVADAPRIGVPGTHGEICTLRSAPTFLLRARGALRRGETIAAMIDRPDLGERATVRVVAPGGPLTISTALVRLALQCDANIVFWYAGVDERGMAVGVLSPPRDLGDPDRIVADLLRFIDTCKKPRLDEIEAGRADGVGFEPTLGF